MMSAIVVVAVFFSGLLRLRLPMTVSANVIGDTPLSNLLNVVFLLKMELRMKMVL
jgi:hypothetical protein